MKINIEKQLKELFPRIKKNEPLKDHTTFKIGGPAEYFLVVSKKEELLLAIKTAKKLKLPIFVFGGGSNLLVSDKGIKGLVIKLENKEKPFLVSKNVVLAAAGTELGKVVDFSVEKSLEGLEWAGGLPGSFGGAIRGNAGAFGGEIKDCLFEVQALDNKLNLRKFSNKNCQFSYRNSLFKKRGWIIIEAKIKLKKGDKKELKKIADSRIAYRKERHPLEYPNSGSIFKNVDFKKLPSKFKEEFKDKVKKDPFEIVPSAWLIIGAGLTGKKIGGAEISKKHSNYIVNTGKAKASDIAKLIKFVQNKVAEKYKVKLEPEVQFVGF